MKKVMIAVALAAIACGAGAATKGTVNSSDCSFTPDTPVVIKEAAVYAWKFTGKTTVGKLITTKIAGTPASDCGWGGTAATTESCAIRVPGSLAIQGYVYYCDNCCDIFTEGTAQATDAQFYMTKPYQAKIPQPEIAINKKATHIIGTSATQYEAEGVATFPAVKQGAGGIWTLTFAGFGSYNKAKYVTTAVNGNFAGTMKFPYYVSKKICVPADYWTCLFTFAGNPETEGIAYGTWSVRYNASASKKYKTYATKITIPAWAR